MRKLKLTRQQEKAILKMEMANLLKELQVSKQSFKAKMPRAIGSGLDFKLPSEQKFISKEKVNKGKKLSLPQQVEYLRRLLASYVEMKTLIDEEVARVAAKGTNKDKETEVSEGPTFNLKGE